MKVIWILFSTKCYVAIKTLSGFTKPQMFCLCQWLLLKGEVQILSLSLWRLAEKAPPCSPSTELCGDRSWVCGAAPLYRAGKTRRSQKWGPGILNFLFSRSFVRRGASSPRKLLMNPPPHTHFQKVNQAVLWVTRDIHDSRTQVVVLKKTVSLYG